MRYEIVVLSVERTLHRRIKKHPPFKKGGSREGGFPQVSSRYSENRRECANDDGVDGTACFLLFSRLMENETNSRKVYPVEKSLAKPGYSIRYEIVVLSGKGTFASPV